MKSKFDSIFEAYISNKTLNENYDGKGAVNLLDQLKEEVPELEDKINQILSQVFDVVDILNQEPYADDPVLGKAYGSLIDDHVRPMGTFKEDNEDFGNTDYDVEEPSVFERLESLMRRQPKLIGVLKPILLEFEDALMEIDKIDNNDFDPQEVFTSLARLYPF
jgi:hypothetical protein